jgi:hypothetical protein
MNVTLVQQALVASASLVLLLVALRRGRNGVLTLGLTIAWASVGGLGLVASTLIPYLEDIGLFLGVTPSALLAGGAAVILSAVALDLSSSVTRKGQDLQDLTEALGRAAVRPALPAATDLTPILAVVPALNEARSVGDCVRGLHELGLPVLIVDDGSTDGTADVARQAGASVLRLELNQGVGGALRAGLRAARALGYRAVVQSDADGQHSASAVAHLLEVDREAPCDLTIGSRFLDEAARRATPFARRTAHRILARLASRPAGCRLTDTTSGLRIIREPLLGPLSDWMPPHYLGDTYEVVLEAARRGYSIQEVPVEALPRLFGSSTASAATATRLTLRCLIVTFLPTRRPLPRRGTTYPS